MPGKRNRRATKTQSRAISGAHLRIPTASEVSGPSQTLLRAAKADKRKVGPKRSRGTGLTKTFYRSIELEYLVSLHRQSPELRAAVEAALAGGMPTLLDILNRESVAAKQLLEAEGLPLTDDYVVVKPRTKKWRPATDTEVYKKRERGQGSLHICAGLELAMRDIESPEWFAATILRTIKSLFADERLPAVAHRAFELGRLVERKWWKLHHEARAEAGHALKRKLELMSERGTAAQKRKGDITRTAVVDLARVAIRETPEIKDRIHKLADSIALDPAWANTPGGKAPGLATIKRHLKAAKSAGGLG